MSTVNNNGMSSIQSNLRSKTTATVSIAMRKMKPNITPAISALSDMRMVHVMIHAATRKLMTTKAMPIAEDATPFHPQPMPAAISKTGASGIARRARSLATCNSGAGPSTGSDRASLSTIGRLSQAHLLLVAFHVGFVSHPHFPNDVTEHHEEEDKRKDRCGAESTIEQPTEKCEDSGRRHQLEGACERVTETGIEFALFLKIHF